VFPTKTERLQILKKMLDFEDFFVIISNDFITLFWNHKPGFSKKPNL